MNYIRNSGLFLILTILFCATALTIILTSEKGVFYLGLNARHTPALDVFFKWITHLGDGLVFIALALLALFRRIQWFVLFILTYLSSGLLAQFLKKVVFSGSQRPTKYFEDIDNLHLVEGVDVHNFHSFPSGHTASAFALFLLLSLLINNKSLSVLFFAAAALVGVSRVYLSQHFLEDVLGGAVLGVLLTILCHRFASNNAWLNRKPWMQLSLQKAFKQKHEA